MLAAALREANFDGEIWIVNMEMVVLGRGFLFCGKGRCRSSCRKDDLLVS